MKIISFPFRGNTRHPLLADPLHIQLNRGRGVPEEVRGTRGGVWEGSLYFSQPVVFYDFADAQLQLHQPKLHTCRKDHFVTGNPLYNSLKITQTNPWPCSESHKNSSIVEFLHVLAIESLWIELHRAFIKPIITVDGRNMDHNWRSFGYGDHRSIVVQLKLFRTLPNQRGEGGIES